MYCLICQELIIKEITYKNIFRVNPELICNLCFTKQIYIQKLETLPIDKYQIYLNVLFDKVDNPFAFMSFLKPYYLFFLKKLKDLTILYFDTFNILVYNIIQNISFGDIYIIVLDKENEKGE